MDFTETNRRVIEQFRAGGPIEGMHRDRLLLLTTRGRTTGQPHTTPMMFDRDGDELLVIASNVGAPEHPDWFRNLISDPRVVVEVGTDRFDAIATPTSGDRRERVVDAQGEVPVLRRSRSQSGPRHPGRGAVAGVAHRNCCAIRRQLTNGLTAG